MGENAVDGIVTNDNIIRTNRKSVANPEKSKNIRPEKNIVAIYSLFTKNNILKRVVHPCGTNFALTVHNILFVYFVNSTHPRNTTLLPCKHGQGFRTRYTM